MDRIITKSDNNVIDIQRIKSLSNFQLSILKKAVTFPNVNTIVYSTCSIHKIENEDVVARFLDENRQYGWHVESPSRFIGWRRRGLQHDNLTIKESNALLRCDGQDDMNGFFVALFRKKIHIKSVLPTSLVKRSNISTNDDISHQQESTRYYNDMKNNNHISNYNDNYGDDSENEYGRNIEHLYIEKKGVNKRYKSDSSLSKELPNNSSDDNSTAQLLGNINRKRSSLFMTHTSTNVKLKKKKLISFWRPYSNTSNYYY